MNVTKLQITLGTFLIALAALVGAYFLGFVRGVDHERNSWERQRYDNWMAICMEEEPSQSSGFRDVLDRMEGRNRRQAGCDLRWNGVVTR